MMSAHKVENQLNEQQKASLLQFRERIKDCKLIDSCDDELCKWLIVKNYDVMQAEKILRQTLEWREAKKIDTILETFKRPEVYNKYFSMGRVGTDKQGCPLWMSNFGSIDLKGLTQSVTKKDINRIHCHLLEEMMSEIRLENKRSIARGGGNVTRQTMIYDMQSLSLKQITSKCGIDTLLDFVMTMETHYVDVMRKMIIINTPAVFSMLFSVIRPFLNKVTVDKICMYGCKKDEWVAALLKEIDADQLPAAYGGTMTVTPSKFNSGGEVPKTYYLRNCAPVPEEGMETLSVPAGNGGKKTLPFEVHTINSILSWKFMTVGYDIAFRVYYKNSTGAEVELIPSNKVESHLMMEEGEIICDTIGKYFFEFENSFSYLKSKKVHYSIVLLPPVST